MKDYSNENLLHYHNNKKNKMLSSFDSISEKQEESSNSSCKNSKLAKQKSIKHKKSIIKSNDISKEVNNIHNISIRRAKKKSSKILVSSERMKSIKENYKKNYIENDKEKDNEKEKDKLKQIKKKDFVKKKSQALSSKRISLPHDYLHSMSNQININEDILKKNSSKNIEHQTNIDQTFLREKKSLNISLANKVNISIFKNSISGNTIVRNKSANLSNSDLLGLKYFSSKKNKITILNKGKLNLKEQRNMNLSILFEKLKDSYLFEKSEALLFKIKICYAFLAVFSFISILLEIIDVIIFNKKSEEFLRINYNIYVINNTNVESYFLIEKRKISKQENSIRVFNLIFCILCFFLHLIIHFIKNNFYIHNKKKKYHYNYNKRRKTKYGINEQNNNENHIKLILNDDLDKKNFVSRNEIIKLIINCVISLIFYPPGLNKVFIGVQCNSIYVYSLNSFFLIFAFFKITNIYLGFYYLSPFNNLLYKTICSSNMIKMNFKFMFRFILNLYPITFILFNFIIIGIVLCILLYCIEYFSINIYNGSFNNKGENNLKNFYNVIYLYLFFIIKSIHGNIKTETDLGSLILLIGGSLGLLISSYFIYYINQLVVFKPDEQRAYSKLVKLLNPLNNEHKAANLIKVFMILKKIYIDNKNVKEEYRLRKKNKFKNFMQRNFGIRKSNFNFATNDSNNSLINLGDNNEYNEKQKLLKYILSQFILKAKLIIECKNFKNNLLIARNNSLSFNDVLKTLVSKMNGNINQLNNKIEILIKNDEKFKKFLKFQESSLIKLKKIMEYQKTLINYLINRNNEINVGYLKENKESQSNFKNKYSNPGNGAGPRRMKSSLNGNLLSFNKAKKPIMRKKSFEESDKQVKIREESKELLDSPKKFGFKKLKTSHFGNKSDNKKIVTDNRNIVTRSKTNPIIRLNIKNEKIDVKSFDDNKLKICSQRKKINKFESDIMDSFRNKIRSLSGKKKVVINKWKIKLKIIYD